MKMKLPEKIVILGRTYKVIELDDMENEGEIDYRKKVIMINSNLSYADKKQTLFHECLHGVLHENSVTITSVSEDMMDIIVNSIANWLSECKSLNITIKRK